MGIYDDYLARVAMAESGGRADAQNPNSSAAGPYQFIDSTWLQHAGPLRPDLDKASLLALKKDPAFSKQVAERFTASNDETLRGAGIEPNDQYRSLAHFAGPQGAINLIKADPNASAGSVLGEAAVNANPFLRNMTAAQAVEWANSRLNGKGAPSGGAIPGMPTGQPKDTAYVDSLLQGGPLALFGKGREGYSWGNALMGVAASLASANSPQQAAVMAGMRKKGDEWTAQVDNTNGRVIRVNNRTGQVQVTNDPTFLETYRARKKIESGYKAPSDKAVGEFSNHQSYLDTAYGIAEDTKSLQETLSANPNFGSWLSRAKALGTAAFDPVSNTFKPETRKALEEAGLLSNAEQLEFYNKLERMKSKLVLAEQLQQKGVQTEGDAIRMGQAFFNGMSTMSPQLLNSALNDIRGASLRDHTRVFNNYKGYIERYGEYDQRFSPSSGNFDRFSGQYSVTNDAYKRFEEEKKNRASQPAQPQQQQQQQPERRRLRWSVE
jgi:hypothetical protein